MEKCRYCFATAWVWVNDGIDTKLRSWPAVYYYVICYTLYMIKQYSLNSGILIKKYLSSSLKNIDFKKLQNH